MIAAGGRSIEIYADEHRRFCEFDISFFGELAAQRLLGALSGIHSAAGHQPAANIGVPDKEQTTVRIEDSAPNAQCDRPCNEVKGVKQALNEFFGPHRF